eukprot:jgi/Mesvir1/24629/Mv21937-RA.1
MATVAEGSTPFSGSPDYLVLYVTVPSKEVGKSLASGLVQEKLAACVNIIPGIESVYWWQDKVQSDAELLLMVKTAADKVSDLTAYVCKHHPYDTPEVIAVPIVAGSAKYLRWIDDSVHPKKA